MKFQEEKLYDWGQTPAGKSIILLLGCILIFLLDPMLAPSIIAALVALVLFPTWRWPIIFFASAYQWFWAKKMGWDEIEATSQSFGYIVPVSAFTFRALVLSSALLVCAGFIYLKQKRILLRPVLALFVFFTLLILLWAMAGFSSPLRAWGWAFILIFGKFVWYLAFELRFKTKFNDPFSPLASFFPYWQNIFVALPVPNGNRYLEEIEAKDPRQFAVSQIKGLRLLLWVSFLTLLFIEISWIAFGEKNTWAWTGAPSLHLPDLQELILTKDHVNSFGVLRLWAGLILSMLCFMATSTKVAGFAIGVVRLAGYNAFREVYRPFEAKTFTDFWQRVEYYYVKIVMQIFFWPIYDFYIFLSNKQVRLFVATLSSVVISGILFHFFREAHFVAKYGLNLSGFLIWYFVKDFVYLCFLGALVGFNALWRRKERKKKKGKASLSWAQRAIHVSFIFFVWFLAVSLRRSNSEIFFLALKKMFFLS